MLSYKDVRRVAMVCLSGLLITAAIWHYSTSVGAQTTTIPLGTYIATIAELREGNSSYMMDEVKVSFLEGGKFTSGQNDWINAVGNYSVVGDRVEFSLPFGADSCAAKGVYQWSVTGNKLTLALAPGQPDDCRKRTYLQKAQTYFKVDPTERHWKTIGPVGGNIQSLLIHDGKIFAGTWDPNVGGQFGLASGGGVFVSEDNGQSWKSTQGMRGFAVVAMAAFNGALYAATSGSHGSAVFISLDGGQTWEASNNNNDAPTGTSIYRFATGNGKLYAIAPGQGVLRLTDNPYVWEKLGTTGLPNLTLNAIAVVGANLFVSTGGSGIYVSSDGNNWTWANNGLYTLAISTLAASGNALYAGTSLTSASGLPNEVFVTTDNGQNWTRMGNGLAASLPGSLNQVFQLAVGGGKLFAASSTGVLVNEGGNWRIAQQLASNPTMVCLAVKDDLVVAGNTFEGVARSLNGGITWSLANNGLGARTTYAVLKANNVLYTGGYSGAFISTNEGQSWTNTGLVGIVIRNFLAFDGKVWAGTSNGVYVTANQGQSWTRVSNGLATGNVMRIVAVNNVLYAAVSVGGVFRSDNGGLSWTAVNTGLTNLNVLDLVARGNYLFASTANNQGVMRSVEGQSWTAVNNGLPTGFAFSLAASGNTLLVAMFGQGIYRSTDNGETWTKSAIGLSPPAIFTLYASGGNIYASGDLNVGALRSTDGGQSWTPINTGFDPRYAYGFFAEGPTLYAATIFGVCHSQNLVNQHATVSAASYSPSAIADKAIVAAFGVDLALSTEVATSVPLPTTLAGTTVKVRDSNGVERLAPLFFVSAGQINYQIPAGTAAGTATVTITNGNGVGAIGMMELKTSAPAIFTTNASGTGAAAAVDAITGAPGPFNATMANGQPNIISVFGTGLGGDATDVEGNVNANMTARIDDYEVMLQYAGRAPGFVGLNQFNVILPAGISAGTHMLTFTRGGVSSNTTTLAIR